MSAQPSTQAPPRPTTPSGWPSADPTTDRGTGAIATLSRHADNPSAFLALNRETRHHVLPGVDGLIAYRHAGRRTSIQLGGVFAAAEDAPVLLDSFLAANRRAGRRTVAVQLLPADTALYAARGFRVNQFGSDYAVPLAGFSLAGKRFVKLRNKLSRARRAGVEVVEVGVDAPATAAVEEELAALERQWLRDKGRHTKPLTFMVGERGGPADAYRRLFLARREGGLAGFLSFSPVWGRHPGWLHDLSRRDPQAPPGTAELLTLTALERFRNEGAGWLHLGFTPFAGLADEHRVPGAASPVADRLLRLLAERGERLYPAADQEAYKLKWAPRLVQPEYVAVQGHVTPGAVWALLRLTQAL